MGRFKQLTAALSEPATTPPISPQGSTILRAASFTSSSISRRVSSLRSSVKKSVKAIVRPLKKACRALSSCTTNNSTLDKDGSEGSDDESSDNAVKQLGAPLIIN